MSQPLRAAARPVERRRFQRVKLALLGRFMLENQREYPCQSLDISPGGLALRAPVLGDQRERVVVYLEELGRFEGPIVRFIDNGFAISFAATRHKQERLANQLTWIANRDALGLSEDRSHARVTPRRSRAILKLPDGRELIIRIIDVSRAGAAIETPVAPEIGAAVVVGRTPATVSRHFQGGIGVAFNMPLVTPLLDEDIQL